MAVSSAVQTGLFKYRAITEPDGFRLVLLKPASTAASPLECSLLHSTLSTYDREIIDHYTALSYVWGDAQQTRQILVDGHLVTITATLDAALRDLRDTSRILRVWADALCIDQSNVEERNQQVRQMGRIYSTAHHTVIYLGSLTPLAEKVLRAAPSRSTGRWINLDAGAFIDISLAAETDLVRRPWFNRVWVFQELVLSRDPWVQCGRVRVRWTDLCDLLLSNNGKRAGLKLLTEMHFARERRVQTDLFNLLLSRRGLGATDARDMVFAHLGVASDAAALVGSVNVDYMQSVERLYEDVAHYLIDTAGPETIFFHLHNVGHTAHRQGLASWAPDWSLLPSSNLPIYKDNRMNVVSLKPKLHYKFIRELPVLAYIGYEVDIINSASLGIYQNSQKNSAHRTTYQKSVEDLKALYASVGGSYASGDANGQYTRIPLEGKRKEHQNLYLSMSSEWLRIMDEELPSLSGPTRTEERDSHARFAKEFENWLKARATQEIIAVGGDAEGMESILYTHLHPVAPPSVLNGRRLACMKSGRIGVVPILAREGDIVIYLAGNPVSLVLRPMNLANLRYLDRKIYEAFGEGLDEMVGSKSPYWESFLDLIQGKTRAIRHASLVGECYVEGVIGWSFKERYEHYGFNIYALH